LGFFQGPPRDLANLEGPDLFEGLAPKTFSPRCQIFEGSLGGGTTSQALGFFPPGGGSPFYSLLGARKGPFPLWKPPRGFSFLPRQFLGVFLIPPLGGASLNTQGGGFAPLFLLPHPGFSPGVFVHPLFVGPIFFRGAPPAYIIPRGGVPGDNPRWLPNLRGVIKGAPGGG